MRSTSAARNSATEIKVSTRVDGRSRAPASPKRSGETSGQSELERKEIFLTQISIVTKESVP